MSAPALNRTLFVVAAPSGAGKTSLVRALIAEEDGLRLSVSHTTRQPRPGEVDGLHYHFVSHARFDELVAQGAFLEHATVFGQCYGTTRAAVQADLSNGRDVLLEIDWQGARQVRAILPCRSIFILPPSREELLRRLRGRGLDSEQVIRTRHAEAHAEISHHAEFDHLVVNDDFDVALADMRAIIRAERLRTPLQRRNHAALIAELLAGQPAQR